MNNAPYPFSSAEQQRPRVNPTRQLGEYRANGAPVLTNGDGHRSPDPQPRIVNGGVRRMPMGATAFDGPRSPPNTKNTSHVPCKFFKSGQCQAGRSCPFLHSTDNTTVDTPCKYFAKGNCKFGAKCALAHVLPDGRRVNRPYPNVGAPLNGRERADRSRQDTTLVDPTITQYGDLPDPYSAVGMPGKSEYPVSSAYQSRPYSQIPLIDTGFLSRPESQYGSPPEGNRLPLSSPTAGHLSVLDAPMPASFDSQGISLMARYGPIAASMPSKVFIESPPSSLPRKIVQPSDTLRDLHESAFAKDLRSKGPELGSSPSIGSGDEGSSTALATRMQAQRMSVPQQQQPNIMSKSLPRGAYPTIIDDWESEDLLFGAEEDLVPSSLHELLTPQEKMRRVSRTEQDRSGAREAFSGLGTPAEHPSSKFGSPPTAASPSRYGALFAKQKQEEAAAAAGNANGPSRFGHVGSPLRNSSLHPTASIGRRRPSISTQSGNANESTPQFTVSSITDHQHLISNPSSMSALSQQLSHTRLGSSPSNFAATIGLSHKANGSSNSNSNTNSSHTSSSSHPPSLSSSAAQRKRTVAPSYSSIVSKSTNSSSSSKTLTPPVAPQKKPTPSSGSQARMRIEEESQLGSDGGVFTMESDENLGMSGRRSQDVVSAARGRLGNSDSNATVGSKGGWGIN